jgi:hypothetical protein
MLLSIITLTTMAALSPETPSAVVAHAPADMPAPIVQAVDRGVDLLLEMQEGALNRGGPSEWPYQGVYRVRGKIPIGYQVGGTGIAGEALLRAPGYAADARRTKAIARAIDFVCASTSHTLMNPEYDGGYDVRGWGYCYGLRFLLAARELAAVRDDQKDAVEAAIDVYIAALQQIEIPETGGWTYSRRGINDPCAVSPFMTAPSIQTLYQAAAQGEAIDAAVVTRALDALERSRSPQSGNVAYSSRKQNTADGESIPGAMGRMTAVEGVFSRSARGSEAGIARSVDAFIDHWNELEKRRKKTGTHKAPYGVAPYYFFYAHYHAADTAELLPEPQRTAKRAKINELLFSVQEDNGAWNDRVFDRSANYGTAMAVLSLMKPWSPPPAPAPADAADATALARKKATDVAPDPPKAGPTPAAP